MNLRLARKFAAISLAAAIAGVMSACGGGSSPSPSPVPTPTPAPTPTPSPTPLATPTPTPAATPTPSSNITPTPVPSPTPTPTPSPTPTGGLASGCSDTQSLTGTLTYDFVPHFFNGALNFDSTRSEPIKGAVVQLLSSSDVIIESTISDETGGYCFEVNANTDYRVRVLAKLERDQSPTWDVAVTDNTDGNSQYAMEGDLLSSGEVDSIRDLHADSGWNTGTLTYSSDRVAAPFAILDSVYELLDTLETEGFDEDFPATELRWSINNTPDASQLNVNTGDIGTSFFTTAFDGVMYILGDADVDTDEFDRSVVQHEFGHYIENQLSRSESIGGAHSVSDILDPRVAFGEGFANAVTAIVSGTGYYEDAFDLVRASGFRFSLETQNTSDPGWFSEDSVGNIIYDLADDVSEAGDNIDLSFADIINVLVTDDYKDHPSLTTIYLYLDQLKASMPAATDTEIDNLAEAQLIFGTGPYGEGETNDGDISISLPVYNELASIGSNIELCSRADSGPSGEALYDNYLGVHRFLRFEVTSAGTHTFEITQSSGLTGRDPDAILYSQGSTLMRFESGVTDSETGSRFLSAGEYVLDIYDYLNTEQFATHGAVCFDVEIRQGS